MVAQGPDLPIHLGSMPDAVRAVVRRFPDVAPGDVFIHNDPYQGGSHLPDVNVVAPASTMGGCSGSVACGRTGRTSAARRRAATARSPKSMARGCGCRRCGCIATASPIPTSRRSSSPMSARRPSGCGDLRAQVAANWRAQRASPRWRAKYGAGELLRDHGRGARLLRNDDARRPARLPDGEAEFADVFDGDGVLAPGATEDETVHGKAQITKQGDTITADFAGSDARSRGR